MSGEQLAIRKIIQSEGLTGKAAEERRKALKQLAEKNPQKFQELVNSLSNKEAAPIAFENFVQTNVGKFEGNVFNGFVNTQGYGLGVEKKAPTQEQQAQLLSKQLAGNLKSLSAWSKDWGGSKLLKSCESINKNNVIDVLNEYDKISPNESLISMIYGNSTMSTSNHKKAIKIIFNALNEKTKETGVDTSHFEEEFQKEISQASVNSSILPARGTATKSSSTVEFLSKSNITSINNIVSSLINTYKTKSNIAPEITEEVKNTPLAKLQETGLDSLNYRKNEAQKAFDSQMKYDGWAGDLADKMSIVWGSNNRAKLVRKDLETFNSQIKQLEMAKTQGEKAFNDKFHEIFGIKYNPEMIIAHKPIEEKYQVASACYGLEQYFNKDLAVLLKNSALKEETQTQTIDPQIGLSQTIVTATKQQVYDREFNKFAQFAGQGDLQKGKDALQNALTAKGLNEKSSVEDKYKVLNSLAKDYSNSLHANTVLATENKGFEAVSKEYEASYKVAFGVKNDIARRVAEYNNSQIAGAAVIKGAVVIGGTIAVGALTGGAGLSFFPALAVTAGGTAGLTMASEFSDRLSSGYVTQGLKKDGFKGAIAGVKEALPQEEVERILKSAGINGATVIAGGLVGAGIEVVGQTLQVSKALKGVAHVISGTTVGAGAEYAHTGTITIEGLAFAFVLSATGQIIAMKKVGVADNGKVTFDKQALTNARKTLGIADDVPITDDILKNAYRSMAKQYHPDKFAKATPEVQASMTAKFQDINLANELLKGYVKTAKPSANTTTAKPQPKSAANQANTPQARAARTADNSTPAVSKVLPQGEITMPKTVMPKADAVKAENIKPAKTMDELKLQIEQSDKSLLENPMLLDFAKNNPDKIERISVIIKQSESRTQKFKGGEIAYLAHLDDTPWANAKDLLYIEGRIQQFKCGEIDYFAKLDDTQWVNAKDLLYIEGRTQQFNGAEIAHLAKLDDTQWAKAKDLLYIEDRTQQFECAEIAKFANLDDTQWAKVQQRGLLKDIEGRTQQFKGAEIANFATLDDMQWAKVQQQGLLKDIEGRIQQFDGYDIAYLAKLDDMQWAKVKDLLYIKGRTQQFDGAKIAYFANLDDTQWAKVKDLLYIEGRTQQFYGDQIADLAKLDDTQWAKAKDLLYIEGRTQQFYGAEIEYLAKLDDTRWAKVQQWGLLKDIEGRTKKFECGEIAYLAKLDDTQFQRIIDRKLLIKESLFKEELNYKNILRYAGFSDKEYNELKKIHESFDYSKNILVEENSASEQLGQSKINKTNMTETTEYNEKAYPNFTHLLSKELISPKRLNQILKDFPETDRNVGGFPKGFLDNVPAANQAEASTKIYDSFAKFAQNDFSSPAQAEIELLSSLSSTLKKPCKIRYIDSGVYGKGYKVTIDDKNYFLKIFKPEEHNVVYGHGSQAEVQAALYANNHARNNQFSKFYFGRVAGTENFDGFLVTEYLTVNDKSAITPKKENPIVSSGPLYIDFVSSTDKLSSTNGTSDHNTMNGKIFDFGAFYKENPELDNPKTRNIVRKISECIYRDEYSNGSIKYNWSQKNIEILKDYAQKNMTQKDFEHAIDIFSKSKSVPRELIEPLLDLTKDFYKDSGILKQTTISDLKKAGLSKSQLEKVEQYNLLDICKSLTPKETLTVLKNVEKLYADLVKNYPEAEETSKEIFEPILTEETKISTRIKSEAGFYKKAFRKLAKIDDSIAIFTENKPEAGKEAKTPEEQANRIERARQERTRFINDKEFIRSRLTDSSGSRIVMDIVTPEETGLILDRIKQGLADGKIKRVIDIENYSSDESSAYASAEQMHDFTIATGHEPLTPQKTGDTPLVKFKAYTTFQITVELEDGSFAEIQVRGSRINVVAEAEHIIYKINVGEGGPKDIVEAYKALTPEQKTSYDEYIKGWYRHARNTEMYEAGMDVKLNTPELSKDIPQILSMENLIKETGLEYKNVIEPEAIDITHRMHDRQNRLDRGELPEITKHTFEEDDGIVWKSSSNPLVKDVPYYNGQRLAANKNELYAQISKFTDKKTAKDCKWDIDRIKPENIAEISKVLTHIEPEVFSKENGTIFHILKDDNEDYYLPCTKGAADLINSIVKNTKEYIGHNLYDIVKETNKSEITDYESSAKFIQALADADMHGHIQYSFRFRELLDKCKYDIKSTTELINQISKTCPGEDISHILSNTNKDNIDFAKQLCKDENFTKKEISRILSNTNKDNIDFAKQLCEDENFPKEQIADILSFTNKDNIDFAKQLYQDENFPKNRISFILARTNKDNLDFAKQLYEDRNLPEEQMANMLVYTNKDNIDFAKQLYEDRNLPEEQMANMLGYTNKDNIDFAKQLYEDRNFPKEQMANMLGYTNKDNIDFAKQLYQDENFPNDRISFILQYTNKDNIDFAKQLCQDENFPKDRISFILKYTNKDNIELAKQLYQDENFPKNQIWHILDFAKTQGNVEKCQKMFTNENIKDFSIKLLNEEFDIATVELLSKTQAKLYAENGNAQKSSVSKPENIANTSDRPYITQETVKFEIELSKNGIEAKQIEFIRKACENEGQIDAKMKKVTFELIELKVPPKEIGEILTLAKVNGEFRIEIVDDFLTLKNSNLNPLLRKNIAAINNMTALETTKTFNPNIKKQMKGMLEKMSPEELAQLSEKGINVNDILDKLENKISRTPASGATRLKGVKLRSRASIVGAEKIILNKYIKEIPENVWRSPEKFKDWANERIEQVVDFDTNKDYTAIQYAVINQKRKDGIAVWYKYLNEESTIKDDPFAKLMVMEEITKELKPDNAAVPPTLNHVTFEETFNAALQRGDNISFAKAYDKSSKDNAISKYTYSDKTIDGIKGKWITIPQTSVNDPKYNEHVGYIRALSEETTWCLRYSQAETYIQQGNINFFVDEHGQTQVCVRESGGQITEIQKRIQDATVPIPYAKVIDTFVKEKSLTGCESGIQAALNKKPQFDALRTEMQTFQSAGNTKGVFEKMSIKATEAPDGTFIISHYNPIAGEFTLSELGINENILMQNVSEITGDGDFSQSNVINLRNLRNIGGKFIHLGSKIEDIRSLEIINGKKIPWDKAKIEN